MTWLQSFYSAHPEYRTLRVARRSPTSIHFELEPRRNGRGGVYEAHFQIKPMLARAGRVWMPPEFAALGRLIGASVRNPRVAFEMALALPFATVLTLQPDATAGLDVMLRSIDPTGNWGTWESIWVGRAETIEYNNSLIKFNLSSIPSAAVISSSNLYLVHDSTDHSGTATLSVYNSKRAWVESEATWNVYSTGNNWQTAGGIGANDYNSTVIGSVNLANRTSGTETIPLTPTTVGTLDAGYGWHLMTDETNSDRRRFTSSDGATASNRPQLVVTYSLPAGGGMFNSPFAAPFRGPFG